MNKHLLKLTIFTLSSLLVAGSALQAVNAHAGKVITGKKMKIQPNRPGRTIMIKKSGFKSLGGKIIVTPSPRIRHYRGIRIARPYGRSYPGFGFFYHDYDAYKWLAFTAITIMILDNINEEQQRLHEQAQIRATTAEVDEAIIWEDGDASGSVKTTRIGKSTSGRECRVFQQTITVGGKTEQAYGTACQQPDGAWEIVQ